MRIVIADQMEDVVVEEIKKLGEVEYKPTDVKKSLENADVVIVRSATKLTRELISEVKNLKMVIRAGVGLDNVDKKACEEKNIRVLNTPNASSNAVAELVLGLMIAMLRNVQKAHHQMKNGKWDKKNLTGTEIAGKTLGIIGYGRIGAMLGDKARLLGMEIISYNPLPRPDVKNVVFIDSLDDFLAKADVISLHVPATNETCNMINKENIEKMKTGIFIINTSRGEVIDEDALYDACKTGKIAGVALDVYKHEPYTGKLLELENVFFTPHLGAGTKEAQIRIGQEVITILKNELK
ncbi:MAG: hydroxyacid dehydrogenase [Candidatus Micrarchaeota archaeon]